MNTFGWHLMDIELRRHYVFMSWYVQPATAPVSYRDYLKCELPWHKCITHVICSLKKFLIPPYTLRSIFLSLAMLHFLLCHTVSELFTIDPGNHTYTTSFFYSIIFMVWQNVLTLNHISNYYLECLYWTVTGLVEKLSEPLDLTADWTSFGSNNLKQMPFH